jgi:hypothetical protein
MLSFEGRKKAPANEGVMPADGTFVAAHCDERRYRHIPLSGSWRTDAIASPPSSYIKSLGGRKHPAHARA